MLRPPQRRSSSIQNAVNSDGAGETKVTAETPSTAKPPAIPLGWRVATIVWIIGFVGLFLYEAGGLLWGMARRMF